MAGRGYRGKPSKGCLPCRKRRNKCDLAVPECTQCKRAGRACPGYRNAQDLMFRDETSQIVKKAEARDVFTIRNTNIPSKKTMVVASSGLPPIRLEKIVDQAPVLVNFGQPEADENVPRLVFDGFPKTLAESVEDRAVSFFYANYVYGHSRAFPYLNSFCRLMDKDEHLAVSIKAVGLASLSKAFRSTRLLDFARKEYIIALQKINAAIQDPELQGRESTLAAIMLLDQFEKVVHLRERTLKSWTDHVNGAMTLMRLRGDKQFLSSTGIQIYIQWCTHVMMTCLRYQVPLFTDYLALRNQAVNFIDSREPSWRLSELTSRYVNLRVAIREGTITGSEAIISEVLVIEHDVQHLLSTLPPGWEFETIPVKVDREYVYEPFLDVYSNYHVTEILNMIRGARSHLMDVIQEQCDIALSDPNTPPSRLNYVEERIRAQAISKEVVSRICASVPQLAGNLSKLIPEHPLLDRLSISTPPLSPASISVDTPSSLSGGSSSADSVSLEQRSGDVKAAAYCVIWGLYVVGYSSSTPEELRRWVIHQLHSIGQQRGIEQAIEVAGYLERGEKKDLWSVFTMLGNICYFPENVTPGVLSNSNHASPGIDMSNFHYAAFGR